MLQLLRTRAALAVALLALAVPLVALASISNSYENSLLDSLRNVSAAQATTFASLHTADPGETCASELVGGSYARQSISWNAATGGTIDNSNALNFSGMPATSVTHACIFSAVSAGTCLWCGTVTGGSSIPSGATFSIAAGAFDVSLD